MSAQLGWARVRDDPASARWLRQEPFDERSARMKANLREFFELFHPAKIRKIPESTIGNSPVSPGISSLTRTSELVANVAVAKHINAQGGIAVSQRCPTPCPHAPR